MPIAGPFYLAWVEPTETTFDPEVHARMDEYVFSAVRTIAEGEKPLLEIEIENPHVGILSAGRKYWAWFSWFDGTTIQPLFFGRVVGTPTAIFEEVIKISLVAHPSDYKQRVQRVAETLKYRPFYDQVFIDVTHRDDPDTILEAHAKVWDVNPVTHAVTANDILVGDSNIDFTEDDHFYDGMNMTISQPPATAILMDASVSWKQTGRGVVDLGSHIVETYSGDGLIGDWPKPLASLGGGWTVQWAEAVDMHRTADGTTISGSFSWRNKEKHHRTGDTMSVSQSWSNPTHGGVAGLVTYKSQSGFLDPNGKDSDGDPSPTNIPMSVSFTWAVVCAWKVATTLVLQYAAERQRTERVIFMVRADTQPVLVDATVSQETETMNRSGADVGVPIINLLNWSTIAGQAVSVAQVIFPDDPQVPGGKTAQVCVVAGTAGTTPPEFSDVVGFETIDGTVTWASLGAAAPPENAVNWTPVSNVPAGQMLLPTRPLFQSYASLIAPAKVKTPPTGVTVTAGTYIYGRDGAGFEVCTLSGTEGAFDGGTAEWASTGMPSGSSFFIATQSGTTGPQYVIPNFNETLGAQTSDGSVVWTCIGQGTIPVGGITGDTWAPSYFTQDRGLESVEYLAALVRAKLLYRSRCVEIKFQSTYARGHPITTRNTITLHDPRIAGGVALGKVKGCVLSVSDQGSATCEVTLACAAGLGDVLEAEAGEPTYVENGYVASGYQRMEGALILLPDSTDLAYAPPQYVANDDGITFPVTKSMVVLKDIIHGSLEEQRDGVQDALESMKIAANTPEVDPLARSLPSPTPPGEFPTTPFNPNPVHEQAAANTISHQLQRVPIWVEYELKPVNGGPFHKVYNIAFSHLQIPKQIDLQTTGV